ncbi:MAG: SDR family NAD(P)-dependent oxidoreductase [Myxococcales bacterium]|nr:SDR family NAD(P)-dependent oxidoreductase [Myxococcales bacterium]
MSAQVNREGTLAGRVAVVTGASRGIGEAIAVRLAMEGAKVVASARTVEAGEHKLSGSLSETVARIRDAGGEAYAVRCDLAIPEDRKGLIEQATERYGPVEILVNNAAVTYYFPVTEFPEKRYRLMMEVQVRAPFELAAMVVPPMADAGRGHIVYISSGAARHPQKPYRGGRGGTVYGMAKAAKERFSTGLASELYEQNIAVNAISPGLVRTPGTELHGLVNERNEAFQTPVESIAEAVRFIASSEPKEITGRVDSIQRFMKEFELKPVELIGS